MKRDVVVQAYYDGVGRTDGALSEACYIFAVFQAIRFLFFVFACGDV